MTPDITSQNAYEILGVPRQADIPAIKQAFRKLALKHHPDAMPESEKAEASALFARINQAHELLRNADKRRKYDLLLDRGILPDLSQEVGDVQGFSNLASILGEIQSLNIRTESESLLASMERTLRDKLLLPSLIASDGMQETVVDAVRLEWGDLVKADGFQKPPGILNEAWMVVTELRIVVLMRFENEKVKFGGSQTEINWRMQSFPYPSLTNMVVHEIGRAFPRYQIDLEDEDGTHFQFGLKKPRLTRLCLVANTYRLPLKVQTQGGAADDYINAFGRSLIPLLVWCIPFVLIGSGFVCRAALSRGDIKDAPKGFGAFFAEVSHFLTSCGLTTLAFYLPVFLLAFLCARVYRSWSVGRAHQVIGALAVDFAAGAPAAARTRMETPPKVAEGSLLPSAHAEQKVPASPLPVSKPGPEADGPIDVEIPAAVRDALGKPPGSPLSGPEQSR